MSYFSWEKDFFLNICSIGLIKYVEKILNPFPKHPKDIIRVFSLNTKYGEFIPDNFVTLSNHPPMYTVKNNKLSTKI